MPSWQNRPSACRLANWVADMRLIAWWYHMIPKLQWPHRTSVAILWRLSIQAPAMSSLQAVSASKIIIPLTWTIQ